MGDRATTKERVWEWDGEAQRPVGPRKGCALRQLRGLGKATRLAAPAAGAHLVQQKLHGGLAVRYDLVLQQPAAHLVSGERGDATDHLLERAGGR